MILTETEINKISGGSVDYFDRIVFARAIESALLEKLRGGVELPELQELSSPHDERAVYGHSRDQLLAYGAAQRLAGRERAIEEWRVHLLELWEKGNFDLKDAIKETYSALAASPQEKK